MKLYASVQKENIHARTKLRGTERGAKWWGGGVDMEVVLEDLLY